MDAGATATGIAQLSAAIATVTNALSSVAATVLENPIMTIGIAGSVIATGVGLFKSLTDSVGADAAKLQGW